MAGTLAEFFHFLDSLQGRPTLAELAAQVTQLQVGCDDLADFVRFSNQRYQRNLVRAGDWYHVWVMCWKNGQRSPIHDHAHSSCVVRVLRGTLTETQFEFAANGCVKPTASHDLPFGGICATQDRDVHQVSNLQADSADLVTLHVYAPPLWRMTTYSLTERQTGVDVWPFTEGDGI